MSPAAQVIMPATLRHVENEVPVGEIDGINTTFFTKYRFYEDHCQIYLNGLRLRPGEFLDYVIPNDQAFVMNYAPLPGDILIIDYFRK